MSNTNTELYDRDFFEWTQKMGASIRAGRWDEVDRENVAEELESLGRRDRREILRRLKKLITHLLDWGLDRGRRNGYWESKIHQVRCRLLDVVNDSPSLRAGMPEFVKLVYRPAVEDVVYKHRLLNENGPWPPECPYTVEQILDEEFLPE